MPLMLTGETDNRNAVIAELQHENQRLRARVQELEAHFVSSTRAVGNLRHQLTPLYRALADVFGELDVVVPPDGAQQSTAAGMDARRKAVWESWKSKLGGLPARFIDALMLHGAMTQTQLRIAVGCAAGSVAGVVCTLNKAGLINKNGGKISLKEV